MKAVFVTGTDTEVGKTVVCGLLGRYLSDRGKNVITQKPVQTGGEGFSGDLAVHLRLMDLRRSDITRHLADMNPYTFSFAASAHLAAAMEGKTIDPKNITDSFRRLADAFDTVIVEGLGGALVPISETTLLIDLAAELALPVLIVVKNKLGAINHALLTIEAVKARGMRIIGLIFNSDENENKKIAEDNPRIIAALTGVPVLGTLPWTTDFADLQAAFGPIGDAILEADHARPA